MRKELYKNIINGLGGDYGVARLLNIKPPSVHEWRHRGIPRRRLFELAVHAERAGIVSRKVLFPDWEQYWPELKGK